MCSECRAAGIVLSMKRADVVRDYGGISAADRRAERRRKLLTAGRRIWGESGITDVTVRGVCSAAGFDPALLLRAVPHSRGATVRGLRRRARRNAPGLRRCRHRGTRQPQGQSALSGEDLPRHHRGGPPYPPHRHQRSVQRSWPDRAPRPGARHHHRTRHPARPGHPRHPTRRIPPSSRLTALFMVGGANQIIENWLANPKQKTRPNWRPSARTSASPSFAA